MNDETGFRRDNKNTKFIKNDEGQEIVENYEEKCHIEEEQLLKSVNSKFDLVIILFKI